MRPLLAACAVALAAAQPSCAPGTYSFGGAACAPCAPGATFLAAGRGGCAPALTQAAGPTDTAFYLSGGAAEGVSAFPTQGNSAGISFVSDVFGNANGAIAMAGGAYLAASGPSLPAALPTGAAVPWSAAAFVKCAAPAARAGVLEWGASGDALGALSPQAIALTVAGAATPVGAASVARVCDSKWHHVAIVNSPSVALSTYVDGALQLSRPIGTATGYSPAQSELDYTKGIVASMNLFHWLDPANAVVDGTGAVTAWPSTAGAACTAADCVVISPTLLATSAAGVPTVGLLKPVVAAVKPRLNSSVAGFNKKPAIVFSSDLSAGPNFPVGSFANLKQLPTDGTFLTATNSASTGQPTLAAAAFPLFASYIVMWPTNPLAPNTSLPFNNTWEGRVLGGTFNNQIMGMWQNRVQALYSDLKGGPNNLTAAQGWLLSATNYAVKETPYHMTVYCSAARACRMWLNGVLVLNNVVATVGFSAFYTINTVLNSCCNTEISNFYLGELMMNAGTAYTDYQIGAVNQYFNLKFGLGLANAAGITTLGYNYAPDFILPPPSAGTQLRVGWSGDLTDNVGSLFSGALSDLRIYARILNSSEVLTLSQPPLGLFANSLVSPTVPTLGATDYTFFCNTQSTGNGGSLQKKGADGSWVWALGIVPSCVLPSPTPSPTAAASVSPTSSFTPSVVSQTHCRPAAPPNELAPRSSLTTATPGPPPPAYLDRARPSRQRALRASPRRLRPQRRRRSRPPSRSRPRRRARRATRRRRRKPRLRPRSPTCCCTSASFWRRWPAR